MVFILRFLNIVLFSLAQFVANAQINFNFDFDGIKLGNQFLKSRSIIYANDYPYYKFSLDSAVKKDGNYSFCINSDSLTDEANYATQKFVLPIGFQGNKITLKCFIKAVGLAKESDASIWMLIPDQKLNLTNNSAKIDSTSNSADWKEYSITSSLQDYDEIFTFGFRLNGNGKIWFDKIRFYVDDKPLELAKPKNDSIIKNLFPYDSKISIEKLNERQIKDLSLLGKIWGFLKYHHPIIAQGKFNWDYELFKIIPKILDCKDNATRDEKLFNWIDSFGPINSKSYRPEKITEIIQKPSFEWIDPTKISKKLVDKLLYIQKNRDRENYYYIFETELGGPHFNHESSYPEMILPDAGFRLLALFRLWNMIEYFYPYKYAIKETNWNDVLDNFIPQMISSNDTLSYRLTLLRLLTNIHDTHVTVKFADPQQFQEVLGAYSLPVEVLFIGKKAIIAGYFDKNNAHQTPLKVGDIILEINGKKTEDVIDEQLKIIRGSNEKVRYQHLAVMLLRGITPEIILKINRNDTLLTLKIKRVISVEIKVNTWLPKPDSLYQLITPEIGYIYFGDVQEKQIPKIFDKFKNTKGIILDCRTYPSDIVYEITSYLLPAKKPFARFSKINDSYPGLISWNKTVYVGQVNSDYYKGKIVILVDVNTVSAAEYTVMALRTAPKATVIGSQTAGADGNVSFFTLPGNLRSSISGIGVYYPDGRETQRVGIVPDIFVEPTIQGVKEGRDEVLEKAMEFIKKNN